MLRKINWLLLFSLVALAVPAHAQAATSKTNDAKSTTRAASTQTAHKPATQDPSYVIGPQDVLDIDVWKEKELTRTVPVRPDGKISLPLLNDVQAGGLTPTQLADKLTEELKKYITDPQVTVIVTQINSQRVYILGEVMRPGAYPLLPGMNVLQAISSAGGFTLFANTKNVYVLRRVNGKQEKFPFNYKDVINGKRAGENIVLRPGDQIVVP